MMQAQSARRSLGGFFLTGLLLAFLGSILPAWGYHLKSEFLTVGNFFLSMNIGLLASARAGSYLLSRRGIRFTLILSSSPGLRRLTLPGRDTPDRLALVALLGARTARPEYRTDEHGRVPRHHSAL